MNNNFADLAVMQPAGSGIAPLSAAPMGIGGTGMPASGCTGAVSFKRPRQVDLGRIQIKAATSWKPENTTVRTNYNHMTRVNANGDGESGPQPLREHPPA
ncbi:MAG TPA: hypothetical protein VG268_10010 [Streptosporangiaceae bacterium]|nr:hypothetical protein [Streptosporangiaceae bacterium]